MKHNLLSLAAGPAVAMALIAAAPRAAGQTVPDSVTHAATEILAAGTNISATLNGTVNPRGTDTTAWFEWGQSLAYGHSTAAVGIGSGTNAIPVSAGLSNLLAGRIYHFRMVASNSAAVVRGMNQVFWFWSPAVTFNGPDPLTNECHVPFVDTTTVNASPLAIAAGASHSLALKADGTVVGWGAGTSNTGTDPFYGQALIPASVTNVVAIAGGGSHSLALKADGAVVGWGYNYFGQADSPARATNVVAIAAGWDHSLALRADGAVVGWGAGTNNTGSDPRFGQALIPAGATNVVAIAAGEYHSLALKADGTVIGWGGNDFGQTTIAANATNVVAISAGDSHSLALKADGTVVGWGSLVDSPASATNVVAIAAGGSHSLALKADGTVVGWGWNDYGQTTIPANATNVVAIAAGWYHSLALTADGTVIGWGYNSYGQRTVPASVCQVSLALAVTGAVNENVPGTCLLNYRTTNSLGAVGAATRTVVVADTLPPDLALLGDNPLMHELGTPFVDPGATATDLCAGDRTGNIFVWGTVDPNVAGSYPLVYIVTDTSGNLAVTDRTVVVVARPVLTGLARLGNGAFQLSFTNTPGARFTVLASTNLALPVSEWTPLGPAVEGPPSAFAFTDSAATNYPTRYYHLRWP